MTDENTVLLLESVRDEMKRMGDSFDRIVDRLESKDAAQDVKIDKVTAFMNKAVGTIGAISFVAFCASTFTAILTFFFR